MKRIAKLSITPSDSKNEDFSLSLADYFHKELMNRGITSCKKQGYLEIELPSLYEEKYSSLIVDCVDGFVYLRGKDCKDRKFGKLSRFVPKRQSDAFNCVNYSATRIVNRINKLFSELNQCIDMRCIEKIASYFDLQNEEDREFYNTHPEIKELEKSYGKFNKLYKRSNNIEFVKENEHFPKKEEDKWYSLWDKVIENDFKEFFGYEYDFEFNNETGLVTVWVDNLGKFDEKLENVQGKVFFQARIYGNVVTTVNITTHNVEKVWYDPEKPIKFEYMGYKL